MIHYVEQYSPEWWDLRLGKLTASPAALWMTKLDSPALTAQIKLVAWEIVHGKLDDEYQNDVMKRGHRMEPKARADYEFEHGSVEVCGLVVHEKIPYVAASPDAIRPDRPVEIKSLMPLQWMEAQRYAAKGLVLPEYKPQMKWQAWAQGTRLADFWGWHPQPGGVRATLEVTDQDCSLMTERAAEVYASVLRHVERLRQ